MPRGQLFSIVSVTASSFVVWLFIVTQVQPNKDDTLVLVTFFCTLTVWLGSLIAWILYQLKVRRGNREIIYAHVKPSIRQGLLIAATLATLLFLQSLRVLSLWDTLLVMLVPILFEVAMRQSHGLARGSA